MIVDEGVVVNVALNFGFFDDDRFVRIVTSHELLAFVFPDTFVHCRIGIGEIQVEMSRHRLSKLPDHRCEKVRLTRGRSPGDRDEKTGRTQQGAGNLEMAIRTGQFMARDAMGIQGGSIEIETVG